MSDWLTGISHKVLGGLRRSDREDRKREEKISREFSRLVVGEKYGEGQPIDSPLSLD